MPGIDRLLRANRTIMQVPLYEKANGELVIVGPTGSTTPFATPSPVILDQWRQIITYGTAGSSHGGNITCALLDDVNMSVETSETDDETTICSIGNEQSPLFDNVALELTGLRDKNKGDTGVFNLFTWLNVATDIRYAWIDRIGYPPATPFAGGQIISMYGGVTDVPQDIREDRGNLKLQQTPSLTGDLLHLYTLPAGGIVPELIVNPTWAAPPDSGWTDLYYDTWAAGSSRPFSALLNAGTPDPTYTAEFRINTGAWVSTPIDNPSGGGLGPKVFLVTIPSTLTAFGDTFRVRITATNAAGTSVLTSNATTLQGTPG